MRDIFNGFKLLAKRTASWQRLLCVEDEFDPRYEVQAPTIVGNDSPILVSICPTADAAWLSEAVALWELATTEYFGEQAVDAVMTPPDRFDRTLRLEGYPTRRELEGIVLDFGREGERC